MDAVPVKYTIGAVASRTGLTTHTIRAWERRYSALDPERTKTNRRLYSAEEIDRLLILKSLIDTGHSIGQVADLSFDELRSLATTEDASFGKGRATQFDLSSERSIVSSCISAVELLRGEVLRDLLTRASSTHGALRMLSQVVVPLVEEIGLRCMDGRLSIAQEHLATAVIKAHLDDVRTLMTSPDQAPTILVTTPQNQIHEIGALIVSIVAALQSWSVLYLGPNLPAAEIVNAVMRSRSSALCLSIVHPLDDKLLEQELRWIRQGLGPSFPIFVGGQGAASYLDTLSAVEAIVETDLSALPAKFDEVRTNLKN